MPHTTATNPHSKANPWTVQGDLPIPNFNFTLIVEGAMTIPCKSVSSIVRENEFDYIQEGGLNDYVHMRRKGVSKPFTFTVERYAMTFVGSYDPLQEGAEFALPMILLVSPGAGRFEVARRAYVFTGCVVTQKEYGDLNSEQSNLLTEKTTIGYRELIVVSVPKQMNEWAISEWIMSDTKSKGFQGDSGKASRRNDLGIDPDESNTTNPTSKYPIPKKAEQRLWEWDEDDFLGNGERNAKKDMEKNKELLYSRYSLKKSTSDANGGWEKNPRKWGFKRVASKNASAKSDDESSYAIGKPQMGKINPKMWRFVKNKYLGINKNRRMTGDRAGESTYAIGNPRTGKVNEKMWRFVKGSHLGTEANRRMTGDRDSNSSYAIGAPEKGKINPKMWKFVKNNYRGTEANRRMTGDRDSNSSYAIGAPVRGKINPKMWKFVNNSVGIDNNRRMVGDRESKSTYAIGKPVKGKINPKMWKFVKDNYRGTEANRRMTGDRDSGSTYAIGAPEKGKTNSKMWKFVKDNYRGTEANRRMTGDRESNSSYSIGAPEKGKINSEMWKMTDKKTRDGNGKTHFVPEVSKKVPEEGKRLWKFDGTNARGKGTQSARTTFEVKDL